MLKYAFLIAFAVISYVVYTGDDVTKEYDSVSEVRNIALDKIVDPLAKKVLQQASESNLDKIVEKTFGDEL